VHSWRYAESDSTRDLRIDFLRGLVFVLLFTSHFRFFSWLSLIAWERVGIVSSAETFILLAGIVTGAVYGKKLKSEGLGVCTIKLFKRAWVLYKTAIIVAGSIALLRFIPGLSTDALTQFIDPVTGQIYPLYPPLEQSILTFYHVLFLKAVPDQFQVIGLYVALFMLTPIIFWAIAKGHTKTLLTISWLAYLVNFFTPEIEPGTAAIQLTGAQFEFAFPLLAWQIIFMHGVVAGYFKKELIRFFSGSNGKPLIPACVILSLLFAMFSLNHPLEDLPDWATMHLIAPETFNWWYSNYFMKYNLGPGRLLNNLVLLISLFALLTLAWEPIRRALGWLFIPLGQESLYVFFTHIYLILFIFNTPVPGMNNPYINTAVHIGALLLCWFMVKKQFLFRWLPH
jgi:hypothetical protein